MKNRGNVGVKRAWWIFLCVMIFASLSAKADADRTLRKGVIVDSSASGATSLQYGAHMEFMYPPHQVVEVLETRTDKDGTRYVLIQTIAVLHKKKERTEETATKTIIPPLWVDASHLVLFDEMQKFRGCWPFERVEFFDGYQNLVLHFNRDGTGYLDPSEGFPEKIPVVVYKKNDVIGVGDDAERGAYRALFFTNGELSKLVASESPDRAVAVTKRSCR